MRSALPPHILDSSTKWRVDGCCSWLWPQPKLRVKAATTICHQLPLPPPLYPLHNPCHHCLPSVRAPAPASPGCSSGSGGNPGSGFSSRAGARVAAAATTTITARLGRSCSQHVLCVPNWNGAGLPTEGKQWHRWGGSGEGGGKWVWGSGS